MPTVTLTGPNTDVSTTMSVTFNPGALVNTRSANALTQPRMRRDTDGDRETEADGELVTLAVLVLLIENDTEAVLDATPVAEGVCDVDKGEEGVSE